MNAKCSECGAEYEANPINMMGVDRPISPYCPTCRTVKREEYDRQARQALELEERQHREAWLRTCGIPHRYLSVTFATFEPSKNTQNLLTVCQNYAEEFRIQKHADNKSLGIFSKEVWGNGKTHLACAVGLRIMERWLSLSSDSPVYYITETQLFRRLRASFNRGSEETEDAIIDRLTRVPLLIVDDVGKEEVADARFVQRTWFAIINERYNNLLPVVLTANLDPDGLSLHLGGNRGNEATFDRLYEMLGGRFYENQGEGYRQKEVSQ